MTSSSHRHLPSPLESILLVLFFLPVIVFIVTWFQPPTALLSASGLLLVFWRVLSPLSQERTLQEISLLGWGVIFLAALFWVSLSGAGGIGFQNWDHEKHNAIMNDLVLKDWPLRYHSGRVLLVYYLPYYLIPALVGKVAGWAAANALVWLQLLIFVTLTLAWLIKKVGAKGPSILAAILLFILFSGNDWIGNTLDKGPPQFLKHIEWWTRFNYMSVTTQLFWAPNSAVAAWTGTALFLDALERHSLLRSLLVWLLTLFWCPYAAVGMLPFLLVFRPSADGWKQFLHKDSKWAFAACPAAVLAVAFYSAKSASIPFDALWMRSSNIRGFVVEYVMFLILHVVWAVPFVWYFKGKMCIRNELWLLFLVACGVLIVLPVTIGPGIGDFIMKGAMPSLLVFAMVIITVIVEFLQAPQDSPLRRRKSRLVMCVMMIMYFFGSLTALFEIGRGVLRYEVRTPKYYLEERMPTLKPDDVGRHYMSGGNPFLRRILRNSAQ